MGSITKAGPGILKLKTGFIDITSKVHVHLHVTLNKDLSNI